MSFEKLDGLGRKLEALEHALSILGADEATHMAVGGGEKRAEAMSNLAGMYHAQATAPEIADWIEAARPESEDQKLALVEFKRQYINATCLPTEFVERRTTATMRSEQLWRELRAKNDWDSFLPALEGVVALVREEAQLRAEALKLAPYDALMEQYDPGNRTAELDAGLHRSQDLPQGLRARGAGRPAGTAGQAPAQVPQRPLPHRKAARAGPCRHARRRLRFHPWLARRLAPPLLRRRAHRCAHDHALSHRRIPVLADGRAARNRPCALRAGPAQGLVALAAGQGARHGHP